MAEKGFKRKLAAILSADVDGYSRLMDDDEEATVRTLTNFRTAINDLFQQYGGRVVEVDTYSGYNYSCICSCYIRDLEPIFSSFNRACIFR
jgi:class 3 adenylate cyclase